MATSLVYSYDQLGRVENIVFESGAQLNFSYDSLGNRTLTVDMAACCGPQFTIYSKTSNFVADMGAGSYYRVTTSSTVTATLPSSPGDGSVLKFKTIGSGSCVIEADTGDTINHANGVSDQNVTLYSNSGVIELISVENGWDET